LEKKHTKVFKEKENKKRSKKCPSIKKASAKLWLACGLSTFREFCCRVHRHARVTSTSR